MVLYYNQVRGNNYNAKYPYNAEISSPDDLKEVVCYDHVCAEYAEGYRKNDNFISADCSMFDVDNTDSDEPDKWVTPETVRNMFPDVPFYVSYSRNHMKEKNGKAPRPKFHVYFPDKIYTDRREYENLKSRVYRHFTAFDPNATDAARFFFGVENPKIEFFNGGVLLSDFMETVRIDGEIPSAKACEKPEPDIIPEGARHCTLISYAARVLKRHGDTEQAALLFESKAKRCVPQLGEPELTSIWRDARRFFHEKVESDPGYLPPELYEIVSKGDTLKPGDFTDLGQTAVFVRESKDIVRYSRATEYLFFTGAVWTESKEKVHRLVQLLTDLQLKEVSFLRAEARKKQADAMREDDASNQEKVKVELQKIESYNNFIWKYRHSARISAVLTEAKPMLEISAEDLDKDGNLLNTPAGTVDLRTGKQNLHNPLDYCTKITAISPDLKNAEMFYEFLGTITCNDKALEDYLQFISGMCLIGKVYCENLIIAYGIGKNGKSTFFNLLSMVMGDYSGTISTEVFLKNSRMHKAFELAGLRGKRLVLAAELKEGSRLDSSAMKQLCSTDKIHAEKKHKDPFSFTPTHTTILYTNPLPSVEALDDGTWRRLVVIPFNAVIRADMDIKNYAEYLFQNCGGAVLSWMIEGAQKFIQAGHKLSQPDVVKRAIETYRKENNWIQNYLAECCETGIGKDYTARAGELYDNFREYCDRVGMPYKTKAAFKNAMIEAGFSHNDNSQGAYYLGVRIRNFEFPYITLPMVKNGDESNILSENDLEF